MLTISIYYFVDGMKIIVCMGYANELMAERIGWWNKDLRIRGSKYSASYV